MILDYNYSKKKRNFSISYVTESGGKKVLNFNVDKFKTYYSTPKGRFENWDGSRCEMKMTDSPNKFDFKTFIEEMNPEYKKLLDGRISPKLYTFDIETKLNENRDFPDPAYAREEITNISIVSQDLNCIVLGTRPLDESSKQYISNNFLKYLNDSEFFRSLNIPTPYIKYIEFDSEENMLKYFLNIVSQVPILSGWNCIQFDWNYITHRIRNYFPDLSITLSSCTQSLITKRFTNQRGENIDLPMPQHTVIIDMMDVMDMDMAVMPIKESKSLEYISSQTPGLNLHKIDYDGDLQDLYESDYPRYVFYNAIDSILVQLINYRYKTLDNIYLQARYCHTKIQDCFSKIALSECLVFLDFYNRGIKVVGGKEYQEDRGRLLGAYVKNPIRGLHSFVTCNDFASLYPSTIRTCNLSYENFVGAFYNYEMLKSYESDWKYIVIGPNVFKNAGTAAKPELGDFVDKFIDEESLKPYRGNKNYFVSVNGCVYKNDKDYSFRRIQAQLKENRDKDKYLAKQLSAVVKWDVEHILDNKKISNNQYNESIVEFLLNMGYNIKCTNDLFNVDDKQAFLKKIKDEISYLFSSEQAVKLLMNSMYGGSSHIAFYWFNIHLANDITGESRNLIHLMEHHIPDYFRNNWLQMKSLHKELGIEVDEKQAIKALNEAQMQMDDPEAYHEKSWVVAVYGDTDSCISSTNIKIINDLYGDNKKKETVTIEELWSRNEDNLVTTLPNGTEIALCEEKILNYDSSNKLQYGKANYIMRHKVSKPKWKLRTKSGKEVIVTNDHSMIVFRDGKKIEVKPRDIKKTDKILVVKD